MAVCLRPKLDVIECRCIPAAMSSPDQPGVTCHAASVDDAVTRVLQAVADIIRTTLGPRSMLKMLLDASGGAGLYPAHADMCQCCFLP